MKPRYRIGVAIGLVGLGTAWIYCRDSAPTSASPPPSAPAPVTSMAPPPTAPPPTASPSRPGTIAAAPDSSDANTLVPALKQELYRYNEEKKLTVFRDDLDRKAAASFAGKDMFTVAARFLTESFRQEAYSSEDEDMRMALVDYVGDAALGRFSFEDRDEARRLLLWLLDTPLSLASAENRQAKSLIGDRIDLMAYYTQLDIGEAKEYLLRHRNQVVYKYLEEGYSNGLFWLGRGKVEIDQKLAEARGSDE